MLKKKKKAQKYNFSLLLNVVYLIDFSKYVQSNACGILSLSFSRKKSNNLTLKR